VDEDTDVSESWGAHPGTLSLEKAMRGRALQLLEQLAGAAPTSSDPKIARAGGEYQELKTQLTVLVRLARGKDAVLKGVP
jgi:hypothetical protein